MLGRALLGAVSRHGQQASLPSNDGKGCFQSYWPHDVSMLLGGQASMAPTKGTSTSIDRTKDGRENPMTLCLSLIFTSRAIPCSQI